MQGSADAIVAEELRKDYPGGVRALDGVSFRVGAGEIFGLLGPNGAGKSTTVRILTTLTVPSGGRATVDGHDVAADAAAVRRAIGYVAQGSGVDRWLTGRENLTLIGRLHGMDGRALHGRVADLLRRFGLDDAADRTVNGYSGGMRRRLDVAMGLVHRPRVLFLDEPTTGLDPEHRAAMWDEVAALAGDDGLTILLTTHYLEEADRLAGRLAIVDRGRIVAEGSPESLKAGLAGDAVSLGVPAGAVGRARDLVAALEGVHDCTAFAGRIRAHVERGASAVPALVRALEDAGITVEAVSVTRPSLDDVYLTFAGRPFAEAER